MYAHSTITFAEHVPEVAFFGFADLLVQLLERVQRVSKHSYLVACESVRASVRPGDNISVS